METREKAGYLGVVCSGRFEGRENKNSMVIFQKLVQQNLAS